MHESLFKFPFQCKFLHDGQLFRPKFVSIPWTLEKFSNFLQILLFNFSLFFIKISANDLVIWHKLITNEAKYHPTFPKSVLTILVSPYINSIIDFINIGVHTPCLEPNLCSFTPMPGVRKTNICPKFTENCLSH